MAPDEQVVGEETVQVEVETVSLSKSELEQLRQRADSLDRVERDRNTAFKLLRTLEDKVEALETAKEDQEYGVTDGTDVAVKKLRGEIKALREQVTDLTHRVAVTPEDRQLEPWLEKAKDRHPELMDLYKNPVKRLDAYRDIALGLRAAEEANSKPRSGPATGSKAQFTSGSGVVTRRADSEEAELDKFQKQLRAAKTREEREKLADDWAARHPG
jgi:hypothetical protein